MEVVENNCTHFYIRINDSQNLRDAIKDIAETDWKPITINKKKAEVADTPFQPFGGKKTYRAIVQRRKRKDGQYDIFTQSPYNYYAIMTDNEEPESTPQWVIEFYNGRGDSERNFDILNNDFNCNRLPFSFLDANMVYLFAAAISFTLFECPPDRTGRDKAGVLQQRAIENRVMHCKKFLFNFMILPARWIKTGGNGFTKYLPL